MSSNLVDLSNYFNALLDDEIHHKPGNDLKFVPHGIFEVAGTLFDIKGMIQLYGSISKEKTGLDYPPEIIGIKVNHKGSKLQFLQCASWHEQGNAKIGEYRIHYSNNHIEIIPIVYEGNVVDWWFLPGDKTPVDSIIAFTGENERTKNLGYFIQLYKFTWSNPFPDVEITEMDFVSDGKESAPFLMAVTVE
jgi:hypothetical protein